jgi:hypothetical protein
MAVVQGDAMAREWVLHNEKISSVPIETMPTPTTSWSTASEPRDLARARPDA